MQPTESLQQGLKDAVSALSGAKRVLCITGAGLSADSGMPTYRGIGGLYNGATTEEGFPIEVAMSGEMLRKRPGVTWKYLSQIEQACRNVAPNAAHKTIAQMQNHYEVCVLTQNVDALHKKAGSENLIEMHGCYDSLYCQSCDWRAQVEDYSGLSFSHEGVPHCPSCHDGVLRPDVILFGEMLPEIALGRYHAELAKGFDAVLSIGTTSVFPYIAGPVEIALRAGVPSIEINPGDSEVSNIVDVRLRDRAAIALPALLQGLLA